MLFHWSKHAFFRNCHKSVCRKVRFIPIIMLTSAIINVFIKFVVTVRLSDICRLIRNFTDLPVYDSVFAGVRFCVDFAEITYQVVKYVSTVTSNMTSYIPVFLFSFERGTLLNIKSTYFTSFVIARFRRRWI